MALKLKDFLSVPIGAVKKIITYPSQAAKAGVDLAGKISSSKALQPLTKAAGEVLVEGIQEKTGLSKEKIGSLARGLKGVQEKSVETPDILKPKNTAESVGGILGDVGVAIATAPAGGGTGLVKSAGFLPKVAQAAKVIGTEAGLGATLGAAQEGTAQGTLIGGALGAAVPAVGAVARGVGKTAMETLGKFTGAGGDALEGAFNNPNVMRLARVESPEELQEKALTMAKSAVEKVEKTRGNEYVKKLEKLKINTADLTNQLMNARQSLVKNLTDEFDIGFLEGKGLNNLDFSKSTLVSKKGRRLVEAAANDVLGWTDTSAVGLDKLKKRMGKYLQQSRDDGLTYSIIAPMRNSIKETLEKAVPEYTEMTADYARASRFLEDVNKALSLGDKVQKDTAIRKLMSTTRQNNEYRKTLLEALEAQTGKNIQEMVQAAQLTSLTPRGLVGGGVAGLSLTQIFNPASWPMVAAILLSSSPRVVGETLSALGKVKGTVIPKAQRGDLARLFMRAVQEITNNVSIEQPEGTNIDPEREAQIKKLLEGNENTPTIAPDREAEIMKLLQ